MDNKEDFGASWVKREEKERAFVTRCHRKESDELLMLQWGRSA